MGRRVAACPLVTFLGKLHAMNRAVPAIQRSTENGDDDDDKKEEEEEKEIDLILIPILSCVS